MVIYFSYNRKRLEISLTLNIKYFFNFFVLAITFTFSLFHLGFYQKFEIFLEKPKKNKGFLSL